MVLNFNLMKQVMLKQIEIVIVIDNIVIVIVVIVIDRYSNSRLKSNA